MAGFNEQTGHRGGFSPFSYDLHRVVAPGEEAVITVRAPDSADRPQPRGKQAQEFRPQGCIYLRTTGIWQTVWLEPVPEPALRRPRLTPDVANGTIRVEQPVTGNAPGMRLRAALSDAGGEVVVAECDADVDLAPRLDLRIPEGRRRLWKAGEPHLYDAAISLIDGDDNVIDEALSRDIELSMEAGFNGAARACTRRCSKSDSCTTPTGWDTWCGGSHGHRPAGARRFRLLAPRPRGRRLRQPRLHPRP